MTSKANTPAAVRSPSAKVNTNHVDTNGNTFEITSDDKVNSEPAIIDTEDNWIAKFLYGGPVGLTINLTLLISLTVYLVISLRHMFNDEEAYRTIIQPFWLESIIQFFVFVLPVDILLCTFIVLVVYPLSRLSRSTVWYWLLGLSSSAVIFAAIWVPRPYTLWGLRALLIIDWGRLSMKVASFLVECSWSEQVHKKSTMKSLLYFLWIPCLVYRHQYPVARRIRWLKVLCHFWWIFGPGLALLLFAYERIHFFWIDLLTVEYDRFIFALLVGLMTAVILYPILAWFFIFENFCGFHGELLRYPHLQLFGSSSDLRTQPLTCINTMASKWFSRYIYVPVVKSGGSRVKAMWFTMALSFPVHELAYFYAGGIIVVYSIIIGATAAPLFFSFRPKSKLTQILLLLVATPLFLSWIATYSLEFIAWNYSSLPDVDKLPRFRLIPLYMTLLYENFHGSS